MDFLLFGDIKALSFFEETKTKLFCQLLHQQLGSIHSNDLFSPASHKNET